MRFLIDYDGRVMPLWMLRNSARVLRSRSFDHKPMPIIVGAPRSGTTLLRFMLDSHPELAIPPETGFLTLNRKFAVTNSSRRENFFRALTGFPRENPIWEDFQMAKEVFWAKLAEIEPFNAADGYRAFYRLYASRFAKPRWGDKTPFYCLHLDRIKTILAEARFIHIIRDGRDVALSLRQMWFSPGWDMKIQASQWRKCVLTARRQAARCPYYMEVRYEELIQHPRQALERICMFLDLAYDDVMLRYYERTPERLQEHKGRTSPDGSGVLTQEQRLRQQHRTTKAPDQTRVFAWKKTMSAEDQARFEKVGGRTLKELGYEVTTRSCNKKGK